MANTAEQDHDLTKQALKEAGALIETLKQLIASDNLLLGINAQALQEEARKIRGRLDLMVAATDTTETATE